MVGTKADPKTSVGKGESTMIIGVQMQDSII